VTPHGQHEEAGPYHGPAHSGERTSAEPGGYDEFDHAPDGSLGGPGQTAAADEGTGMPVVSDGTAGEGDGAEPGWAESGAFGDVHPDTVLAAERLVDLQRLQAEYVNYKKRVDRDRDVAREQGISHALESMLPVLDEIHLAREHGDLGDGPAATIVDKLDTVLARLGIERFGARGDEFDPTHHEALMRVEADLPEGATTTTVVQVLQPGYRLGERVVRAARVAVADPT
jgi:molecular chaperone GrpE